MNTPNYALYYPAIEFQDYSCVWGAALLWDRIYRIVPEGYEPNEPDNVRALTEAGEIGIPIRPGAYAKEIAEEFMEKIEAKEWDAAALVLSIPETYAKIHRDKVDVELRNLIIAKGKAAAHREWLYVPTQFEALYMTFLAERVSRQNNLQLLSDTPAAWTGSTYFKYDGEIEDFPRENLTQQLATLVVRDFIPKNILEIRPEEILKFREKYRAERQRFMGAIRAAAKAFSEFEDEAVYQDKLQDLKRGIEEALVEFKESLQVLNVVGWTGMKSLSFPVVTKIAAAMTGNGMDFTTLCVVSALGIGVGLVSGFSDLREKRKRLERGCDFSYLMHMGRQWKGCTRSGHDYNYFLCREMEEFIND